jgi:hypothetical protein
MNTTICINQSSQLWQERALTWLTVSSMELRGRHQLIREATQIKLYPNNMKEQDRFSLCKSISRRLSPKTN